jgi:N-acetylmuramic acid 6-phosphate etherase
MSTEFQPLPETELTNAATEGLDRLSTVEMLADMNAEDASVARAVQGALSQIALAVDAVAAGFGSGGRLIYVGAGTSGRLGVLDASECLPTFGVKPEQVFGIIAGGESALTRAIEGAEDDEAAGAKSMDDVSVGANDVVVGISASGGAPFVRSALRHAKARGAWATIGVSNVSNAPLSRDADIAIEVVTGPEVIAGSTRLKAGTAQKMVLNMISTGAMVRIGKTYGNRMVDVQATNAKLVKRSRRLLQEIGKIKDEAEADAILAAAGGSVKRAIVIARRGVSAREADTLLKSANGFLASVIGE